MAITTVTAEIAKRVPTNRQVLVFGSKLFRVSFTGALGRRYVLIVVAPTPEAAKRQATITVPGCRDTVVGRYLGGERSRPTPGRALRTCAAPSGPLEPAAES